MNVAKTSAGNQIGHTPFSQPQYPSAPARKPSGIDPESPRKMRRMEIEQQEPRRRARDRRARDAEIDLRRGTRERRHCVTAEAEARHAAREAVGAVHAVSARRLRHPVASQSRVSDPAWEGTQLLPVSIVADTAESTSATLGDAGAVVENVCEVVFSKACLRIRGKVSPQTLRLLIRELSR
jgi:hypothetical protein